MKKVNLELSHDEAQAVVACLKSNKIPFKVDKVSAEKYTVKAETILPEQTVTREEQIKSLKEQEAIPAGGDNVQKPVTNIEETILPEEKAVQATPETEEEPVVVPEEKIEETVATLKKQGKTVRVQRVSAKFYVVAEEIAPEMPINEEISSEEMPEGEEGIEEMPEYDENEELADAFNDEEDLFENEGECRAQVSILRNKGVAANMEKIGKKYAISIKTSEVEKLENLK